MKMCRILSVAMSMLVASAASASAQGTYVSASFFGDIVRSTHTESSGVPLSGGGGEAMGVALRVGTPLGAVWGVEAEFARPSEIEDETQPLVPLTSLTFSQTSPAFSTLEDYLTFSRVLPSFPFSARATQRNRTLSASLWFHQQLSGRVAMVYLGGMGFYRAERTQEFSYPPLLASLPISLPPYQSTTVIYGVSPLAGVESRISMTEHLQLVPGVRLQVVEDGWLIRPAVGLAWTF